MGAGQRQRGGGERGSGEHDGFMRARLLGCELRRRRQDLGLTISALAAKAHLSPSFVSEIEQGKKLPSLASLDRIAAALGITRNSLIPPPGAGLDAPDLPARVRRARERMGMAQDELAEGAGLSAGMISQIEAGATRPSLETVERLARALCVTPCHLLVEGPDPETLLANLTPDVRRLLLEPEVQAMLQAVAGIDGKGFRAVMEMIQKEFRRGGAPG
ncbi:MAG: helix-turn-helix transcriptional regulator [Bacillota bacterium]|nr:helix-turn-helix transcriptional regulator [Bacillota bacterium]